MAAKSFERRRGERKKNVNERAYSSIVFTAELFVRVYTVALLRGAG